MKSVGQRTGEAQLRAPDGRAEGPVLSIGALSRATGVPVETLRTWERRYGFPQPTRRPSGHRTYPLSSAPRLRRIVRAISQGHRAAHVLALDEPQLDALLDAVGAGQSPPEPRTDAPRAAHRARSPLPGLLEAIRAFDGATLQSGLEAAAAARSPLAFIEEVAEPLMTELGRAWTAGSLEIRHEHFASARLADALRQFSRRLAPAASRPVAALAALPGDAHELGLQMAALLFAAAGWQVAYMGRETPPEQLRALARDVDLDAVAIGVSATVPVAAAAAALAFLRRTLPREVPLLAGGAGVPAEVPGVVRLTSARSLAEWLAERGATSGD